MEEQANVLNSGSLTTLQAGQTLLVGARKVAGGKIQLELAEIIPTRATNPLAAFNESDDRFTKPGARRAWITAEPKDASAKLGIDLTDNNPAWSVNDMGQEILSLMILKPVAKIGESTHELKVQINETVTPTEYQAQNVSTAAKRRGADGEYILHKGMYIFANTTVVFDKANHVFLEPDAPAATLAGGIKAESVSSAPFGELGS